MKTFAEYEAAALDTAVYPGQGTVIGLMYVSQKGAGEAGEFAEHVGKAMRDDQLLTVEETYDDLTEEGQTPARVTTHTLSPERRKLLRKEVGDQLWYLAAKARELGTSLGEIAAENIDKLADRKARGVLGGSGDLR